MHQRSASGFTLIELVITVGTLVLLILGVMTGTSVAMKTRTDSRERDIAREADPRAQERLGGLVGAGASAAQRPARVGLLTAAMAPPPPRGYLSGWVGREAWALRSLIGRGWARWGDVLRILRGLDPTELGVVEPGPYVVEALPAGAPGPGGEDELTEDVAQLFGGRPVSTGTTGIARAAPSANRPSLEHLQPDVRIIYVGGQERVVLGRVTGCDVTIPGDTISRRHARIDRVSPERWTIVDLGSSNGTRVEGRALAPDQPVALGDEQTVQLGTWSCLIVSGRRLVSVARALPV